MIIACLQDWPHVLLLRLKILFLIARALWKDSKEEVKMSRAVAVAASRSAAAADSSTSVSAKRTTKTYTYKTDSSGNVSTEVHTHVDSSSDQVREQLPKLLCSQTSKRFNST